MDALGLVVQIEETGGASGAGKRGDGKAERGDHLALTPDTWHLTRHLVLRLGSKY